MSTHILIPIVELDKLNALFLKGIKEAALDRTEQGKNNFIKFTGKFYGVQQLIDLGKQISLTDEDIEAKAAKFAIDNTGFYKKYDGMSLHTGYKQALKDLL